jgi:hypothetical protein
MMAGWNRNHQPKEFGTPLYEERRFSFVRSTQNNWIVEAAGELS